MYEAIVDEAKEDTASSLKVMTVLAHRAVLFEKIKQKIEEREGKKLEGIAELLVRFSSENLGPEGILDVEDDLAPGDFDDE